jgi:integrase
MATINFKINLAAINDPTKIYIRFKGVGFDSEAPTEILVSKKDWSVPKQKIKPTASSDTIRNSINTQLDELKAKVFEQYNIDNHEGITINTKWLKDVIKTFHNQPTSTDEDKTIFITSFADYFAESSKQKINFRTGNKLDKRTWLDYQNSSEKIKNYEANLGQKIKLSNIDLKFRIEFIEYLRKVHYLGENTIGGIIDNLKAFLREADAMGYKVHADYKSNKFISPSSKTKDIYFEEEEILLLKNHSFELDSYLDNARDWLIIGVWTGLRVSDLLPLTKKDIKSGYIDNTNFKTKIPVTIPLHPHVKEVLEKRNGNFPRKISDQNFNDYIKKVAEQVGFTEMIEGSKMMFVKDEDGVPILDENGKKIYRKKSGKYQKWELVTSHICRRSFATNLYGKIDTLTIMKITGHQTEKQFLSYIKITPKQHAERLSKLWAELYKK